MAKRSILALLFLPILLTAAAQNDRPLSSPSFRAQKNAPAYPWVSPTAHTHTHLGVGVGGDGNTPSYPWEFEADKGRVFRAKAPKKPEDRRENKDQLVLMHYNAEFLFSSKWHEENCQVFKERPACKQRPTNNAVTDHIRDIARVISKYDPDVVNMCEISDAGVLEEMLTHMEKEKAERYKAYVNEQDDHFTGQACGLLTKIDPSEDLTRSDNTVHTPVPGSKCGSSYVSDRGVSKHYSTRIDVNGMKLRLFGVHLLAVPQNTTRCVEREAQATVISQLAAGAADDEHVVIMGDMNDFDFEDDGVTPMAGEGKSISRALAILKGSDRDSHNDMVNVASKIEESDERFTATWFKRGKGLTFDAIDHILVEGDMAKAITGVQVPRIYNSWNDNRCSDHYPVMASIDLDALATGKKTKLHAPFELEDLPKIDEQDKFIDCEDVYKLPKKGKKATHVVNM